MDYPSNIAMKISWPRLDSRKIGFITVMTALIVSLNYLMLPFLNVKLMDLLVFVSGYSMGGVVGAVIGFLVWLVYGTVNPFGFNLSILVTTCLCEGLYGVVGGLCSKNCMFNDDVKFDEGEFWYSGLKLGIIGFLVTSVYDLITNVVSGVTAGIGVVNAIIMGFPFAVSHEVSNLLFFSLAGGTLIKTFRKFGLR
ncbi:ECF transporter S component [Candidatus Bathyarchaeota archaeon]|nr:MAG: ECF transporter S component [Candidatus Bathyarchaeota archaeon]